MKLLLAIIAFVAVVSVRAQTVATTANVLHPIMKDPSQRNAPTSLNQGDPSLSADLRAPVTHGATALPLARSAQPTEIIAKIDASLAASKISLVGTISGIKGRLYVTNIGSQEVTPLAQFAVCNQKGLQIGSTTKTGAPLQPNDVERLDVIATNANAVDLRLMKLSASSEKK